MAYSSLRFIVDIGVGKKVEEWLQSNGYDVKTVRDIDPRAKDSEILQIAASESRMVITMDKDFGELVFKSRQAHAGVLILRIEDATGTEKVEIIKKILYEHKDRIKNKFCVFQNKKLRISRA